MNMITAYDPSISLYIKSPHPVFLREKMFLKPTSIEGFFALVPHSKDATP